MLQNWVSKVVCNNALAAFSVLKCYEIEKLNWLSIAGVNRTSVPAHAQREPLLIGGLE